MADVSKVIAAFCEEQRLIAELLYGCGLRLGEGLGLRTREVDLANKRLIVREGKGKKDRTLPLPEALHSRLERQIARNRRIHTHDLADESYDGVFLPESVDKKDSEAARDFPWYWLFPATELTPLDNVERFV
jgi:integrase